MASANNKVRYLRASVLDVATLSVSSTTEGLPATNVQDQLIRKKYRTLGKNNEWLRFNGTLVTVDTVFIGGVNLTKNAVVRWQGNTTSNFTGCALNTLLHVATDSLGSPLTQIVHCYLTAMNYPFWRLYVSDSGNASVNLEVGRIMAGVATEPNRDMRDGFSIRTVDPSIIRETAGRQGYANVKAQYKEVTYGIGNVDEPQIDELMGIYASVGAHTSFVLLLDPVRRPHHNTIYTNFPAQISQRHHVLRQYDLSEIAFQEKR